MKIIVSSRFAWLEGCWATTEVMIRGVQSFRRKMAFPAWNGLASRSTIRFLASAGFRNLQYQKPDRFWPSGMWRGRRACGAEVVRCQARRLTEMGAFENPRSWRHTNGCLPLDFSGGSVKCPKLRSPQNAQAGPASPLRCSLSRRTPAPRFPSAYTRRLAALPGQTFVFPSERRRWRAGFVRSGAACANAPIRL